MFIYTSIYPYIYCTYKCIYIKISKFYFSFYFVPTDITFFTLHFLRHHLISRHDSLPYGLDGIIGYTLEPWKPRLSVCAWMYPFDPLICGSVEISIRESWHVNILIRTLTFKLRKFPVLNLFQAPKNVNQKNGKSGFLKGNPNHFHFFPLAGKACFPFRFETS